MSELSELSVLELELLPSRPLVDIPAKQKKSNRNRRFVGTPSWPKPPPPPPPAPHPHLGNVVTIISTPAVTVAPNWCFQEQTIIFWRKAMPTGTQGT